MLNADRVVAEWQAYGLDCRISAGGWAFCGYVRIPKALFTPEAADRVLSASGGITYPPDADGWVGFDTGHAGDYWAPDDLAGHLDSSGLEMANTMRDLATRTSFGRRWTMELLRQEVEQLAQQVAVALDLSSPAEEGGSAWSP